MGKCCPFIARSCRRDAAPFVAARGTFDTTARVNVAHFSPVGFRCHAAYFIAVGAAAYATARVNAARFRPLV